MLELTEIGLEAAGDKVVFTANVGAAERHHRSDNGFRCPEFRADTYFEARKILELSRGVDQPLAGEDPYRFIGHAT